MIQMLCTENLDEILMYPEEYVTDDQDLVLYRVCDKDNDYIVMLGVDNDDDFYFVVEDNEVSEYYYCKEESVIDFYNNTIMQIVK